MNRKRITTSLLVAVMISLSIFGTQTDVFAGEDFFSANYQFFPDVPDDAEINRQLAQVRRATAKYHDIETAIADGFVPIGTGTCVDTANGTHGIGYVNIPRFVSPEVDPLEPEILN